MTSQRLKGESEFKVNAVISLKEEVSMPDLGTELPGIRQVWEFKMFLNDLDRALGLLNRMSLISCSPIRVLSSNQRGVSHLDAWLTM